MVLSAYFEGITTVILAITRCWWGSVSTSLPPFRRAPPGTAGHPQTNSMLNILGVKKGSKSFSSRPKTSAAETGRMSSVETGQMSAVETGQMSAAETGQMSAVETRQMYSI